MNKRYWLSLYILFAAILSIVAFTEGAIQDLMYLIVNYPYMTTETFLIITFISTAIVPSLIEESTKLFMYRHLGLLEGLMFAIAFTLGEFLLWGIKGGTLANFDITQIVRFIFPFHILAFFIMRMDKLSIRSLGVTMILHSINNAACFFEAYTFVFSVYISADLLYCVNFVVLAILATLYLTQTKEGKKLIGNIGWKKYV